MPDLKLHPPHIKIDIIRKEQAKNTQRYKVEYDSQSTDTLNFSSESKQETEYVSAFVKAKRFRCIYVPVCVCTCSAFDKINKNGYCCTYLGYSGRLANTTVGSANADKQLTKQIMFRRHRGLMHWCLH